MKGERFEERLEALREEAARGGAVAGAGVRAAGGPLPPAVDALGYDARPLLKPPVWTWEVPLYFFVGGLAGMAAVLALAALVAGAGEGMARTALWIATAGAALSALLLIMDLGRPARFYTMLRVFKHRSPMSVGVWLLSAFGAFATAAAIAATWLATHPALVLAAAVPAALSGVLVATYTGVLLGVTAVPAWACHHRLLPLHFGTAALGSAAAALELVGYPLAALHALGLAAAAVETLAAVWLEVRRHGAADRALRHGRSGLLVRVGGLAAGPVALVLRAAGWVPAAAIAFLAGALISRFAWVAAGRASAKDPAAALAGPV